MDSKDVEAEIHPLKNEDGKLQENLGNRLKKEDNLKSAPLQSRLSRCRTVAFFLSLFICLLVVFVISFIIPCPDRPVSQGMWRINYNTAVTYDFLATEDINRDRIQDVLFLYKTTDGSNNFNQSCADEGFSSPCSFMAAASGANGSILWERPVAQDGALVLCVALFEPSRHAACILLTGPASPDAPGLVSLAKHKVQDLVLSSRVVHLTEGGSDSDQAIRDRLSHLRYQSEA
uniref:FAM234A/B beta-propeller domain-containing protein n=1 Tax=Molossus molossus TaxID=27622 RepID=A0A7J8IYZ8_MOLMO|nr:hypothetical protein HJG59_004902 [Molossus molossus]